MHTHGGRCKASCSGSGFGFVLLACNTTWHDAVLEWVLRWMKPKFVCSCLDITVQSCSRSSLMTDDAIIPQQLVLFHSFSGSCVDVGRHRWENTTSIDCRSRHNCDRLNESYFSFSSKRVDVACAGFNLGTLLHFLISCSKWFF